MEGECMEMKNISFYSRMWRDYKNADALASTLRDSSVDKAVARLRVPYI